MTEKKQRKVKFPENKKIAKQLKYGDRQRIAELAGLSIAHIYDVFQGERRITDEIAKATIIVYNERQKLLSDLKNSTNQQHGNL